MLISRTSSRNTGGARASARTAGSRSSSTRTRHRLLPGRHTRKLERVRERLAAVRKRTLDDPPERCEVGRERCPAKGDERRVDVGRRSEDRAGERDGIPFGWSRAGSGRRRHRRPWSTGRRRSGRQPLAAPSRTSAPRSEARRDSRRRWGVATLYGRFATSFVGAGPKLDRSSRSASPQWSCHVRRSRNVTQMRLEAMGPARRRERGATLGGQNNGSARRGQGRSRVRRRGGSSSASRAMTPRMLSSTRKCCPRDFLGCGPLTAAGSPNAALAFRSIACSCVPAPGPPLGRRACAARSQARSACPLSGWGCEIWAVGLGEDSVDGKRPLPQSEARPPLGTCAHRRARRVATLHRHREKTRCGEAMEDHRSGEPRRARPPYPRLRRACESQPADRPPLRSRADGRRATRWTGTRREIVEVVESRLADSHGSWMAEQIDELIRARTPGGAGLMRVDPERGKDALLGIRDCDRGVAGRDPRANGYDSRHAHRPGTVRRGTRPARRSRRGERGCRSRRAGLRRGQLEARETVAERLRCRACRS